MAEATPRNTTGDLRPSATDAAGPDAKLLRICDELLDVIAEDEALWRELHTLPTSCPEQPGWLRIRKDQQNAAARRRALLQLISRQPAMTAAGIYAKAQVLRRTGGSSAALATALAAELLANAELRRAVWPAEGVVP